MSNIDWEDLDRIYQVLSRIEDLLIGWIEAQAPKKPKRAKKPLSSAHDER